MTLAHQDWVKAVVVVEVAQAAVQILILVRVHLVLEAALILNQVVIRENQSVT